MPGPVLVFGVGPTEGLGAALCRRFASAGHPVFASARSGDRLAQVADEIRAEGGDVTPVVADVLDPDAIRAAFDRVGETGGPPEVVVFNAGNNQFRPLLEMDDAFFEGVWQLCAFAGFRVGREAAERMLPNGGGTLIFTGATASIRARPPFTAFASAKAALRAVAHGMAREFGEQGLHVAHVIIDGMIDGDQVNRRFPGVKERMGEDGMLAVSAIAETYYQLHAQHRSAWSLEVDLRPYREKF